MDKETIFYSIISMDTIAQTIIPELDKAYNMTPHRIPKEGDMVKIELNRSLGTISVIPGVEWIHPVVNTDEITIVFDSNNTGAERIARPYIQYCDATGCRRLLQFRLHQNC